MALQNWHSLTVVLLVVGCSSEEAPVLSRGLFVWKVKHCYKSV